MFLRFHLENGDCDTYAKMNVTGTNGGERGEEGRYCAHAVLVIGEMVNYVREMAFK